MGDTRRRAQCRRCNSISPSSVSAGGGATVTIIGSGFSGATAVYFGPNASSSFSVVVAHAHHCHGPDRTRGTVHVTVVTPTGTSAHTQANQLAYAPTGQLPDHRLTPEPRSRAGSPTKFTGVNAFELATAWGTNNGCGGMVSPAQTAALFASLGPGSLVRFWAFQGDFATDVRTGADRLGPPRSSVLSGRGRPRLPDTDDHRPERDLRRGPLAGPVLVRRRVQACLQLSRSTPTTPASPRCPTGTIMSGIGEAATRTRLPWECGSRSRKRRHRVARSAIPARQLRRPSDRAPTNRSRPRTLTSFFDVVGGEIHSLDPTPSGGGRLAR